MVAHEKQASNSSTDQGGGKRRPKKGAGYPDTAKTDAYVRAFVLLPICCPDAIFGEQIENKSLPAK